MKIESIIKSDNNIKIRFSSSDGFIVEAVYLANIECVCISSQIGCATKCIFCASGNKGFYRNLSTDEMMEQYQYFELNGYNVKTVHILLTHHAPKIDTLGCSFPGTPNEKDFGSIELAESIRSLSGLKYHFCGHIHTGNHDSVRINNAVSYNVSLMDEEYNVRFPVRIVEI